MVWNKLMGRHEDPEIRAYLELMLMLAMADGEIEDSEIDDIAVSSVRHPKMQGMNDRQFVQILTNSHKAIMKEGMDSRIHALMSVLKTTQQRIDAIGMAISVSASDGEIEPAEMQILQKIQRIFGLSDAGVEEAMNKYN